jgi:hypothetical protein
MTQRPRVFRTRGLDVSMHLIRYMRVDAFNWFEPPSVSIPRALSIPMAHGNAIRLMAYDAGRLHHISWNEEGSYFLPEMHDSMHRSMMAWRGSGRTGMQRYRPIRSSLVVDDGSLPFHAYRFPSLRTIVSGVFNPLVLLVFPSFIPRSKVCRVGARKK